MRKTIRIAIGFFALLNVIYKLVTCPSCTESIFGYEMSGPVYLVIYTVLTALIFFVAYKEHQKAL